MRILARAALVAVLFVLLQSEASAQLVDGEYTLDAVDLPVLGSTRALGMGGAFASAGEGINAMAWNPAATGRRAPWEKSWFDWDITFGVLFPSRANAKSFFSSVDELLVRSFTYYDLGLRFQFGRAGIGVVFRPREFTSGGRTIRVQIGHADFAWTFFNGDLVVGAGVRLVSLDIVQGKPAETVFGVIGASIETGATYAPIDRSFRGAVVVRSPVSARPEAGRAGIDGYALPSRVFVPWELTLSATYGFGERILNPPMARPLLPRERRRRERIHRAALRQIAEADDPIVAPVSSDEIVIEEQFEPVPTPVPTVRERYGVVSVDLLIQGRTRNGVGLDGFLSQADIGWGQHTTVSPRIGVEGEPWRDRLKLRGGVYVEPNRSSIAGPRVHFTQGFDFRLFSTDVFGLFDDELSIQVSLASDVAKNYFNFGFGVGFWH